MDFIFKRSLLFLVFSSVAFCYIEVPLDDLARDLLEEDLAQAGNYILQTITPITDQTTEDVSGSGDGEVTTDQTTSTTNVSTTLLPDTTELSTTTETPSSTPLPDTTESPTSATTTSTTPSPDTTETSSATPLPDTTEISTTPLPDTTEISTTPLPDTTDISTTPLPDTTEISTTPLPDTTEISTTPLPDTTDISTTPLPDTTEISTTPLPDTTEISTTPLPDTTEISTTPLPDTTEPPTTTSLPDTTEPPTITPLPDTTEPPTTTPLPDTTEPPTSPTTTSTTPPPTTTRPPQQEPEIDDLTYNMDLSLSFGIDCIETDNCSAYTEEVYEKLTDVFQETQEDLGFQDIVNIRYEQQSNRFRRSSFYNTGNTIVRYEVQYDLATALNNTEEIATTTRDVVFEELKTLNISGSSLNTTYLREEATEELETASEQLNAFAGDLCAYSTAEGIQLCEFGHSCVNASEFGFEENDPAVIFGTTCLYKCVPHQSNCDDDYGICSIDVNGDPECKCGDNTLQISSSNCFPQNNLIFICAVAGGVLIIVVVVLVSVMVYRSKKRDNADRAEDTTRHHDRSRSEEGRATQMPRASQAEDRGSVTSDGRAGSTTFTGRPQPSSSNLYSQVHHNRGYDKDDTDDLESDRRNRQRSSRNDFYNSIDEDAESFKDFQPRLDHIDSDKVYAFRRPMFTSQPRAGPSKKYERRWQDAD